MKIKTITCHDVYNVGASLQAYALMKYLTDKGHDVEIIDYKPDYLSHHYQIFYADNPAYRKNFFTKSIYVIAKLPKKIRMQKRKKIFDRFTKRYLRLTQRYHSNEEMKKDCPVADVYVAGSDQIWNPIFPNGKDPAFYLDFAPDTAIKASYAASFATTHFPDDYAESASKMLSKLDYISVREKSGIGVLHQLGIDRGCEVLDPVFLLSKEAWSELAGPEAILKDKYLLVYDFEQSEVIQSMAQKIAYNYGLKIVSVFKSRYADINYIDIGPLEFLNLVKYSEFVISNSFHATAFSVIFKKNFYVVGRKENVNSRMIDFLKKMGLEERYVTSNNVIPTTTDYTHVDDCFDLNTKKSKDYLDVVLERND